MTARLALVVWLLTAGCYQHHERPPIGDERDAQLDAGLDALTDAPVDAPIDAPVDAPLDAPIDAPNCQTITLAPQPIMAPVDIVWAIDGSRSMQDERDRLQATINLFATRIRARVRDLHVIVISTEDIVPPPLGEDASSYRFVPRTIDSHDVLSGLLDALPQYRDFLRPSSLLHLVAVSDDDSALSAGDFLLRAQAELGRSFTLHAIASPDINGQPCRSQVPSPLCLQTGIQAVCGAAAIGTQYYAAAAATQGLSINVCLDDWTEVIGPLSDAVVGAEPLACEAVLPLSAPGGHVQRIEALLHIDGMTSRPIAHALGGCDGSLQLTVRTTDASDFDEVVLCPETCETARASGGEIELRLDCPPLF